ncbi:LacI family transcriptional regulator [Litorimonas taeanensis]|uniref:LacI family transcriptional regulator n=1 Tax=Litorimonas taeanensis TaxID=568099 RepID=A0A420WLJ5_9PROT|nr:LacI family DNA-binding transcriptional regulator [Litorimonas taeanensis]RKQ71860.1 LacI family transcriptional regulator [Litorimonas taeanensis]
MKATITDVAKQAGVSMKTVSRVLNNEPNVADKTREKVLEVASALRYSPNLAAKGLASSKSYLVALVYDIPSAHYVSKIQLGAIAACREFGYHLVPEPLMIGDVETNEQSSVLLRNLFSRLPVDGVILAPPLSDSAEAIEILDGLKIPYVLVAPFNVGTGIRAVKMDDVLAAEKMTQFLIDQGHSSIGFIKGHTDHSAASLRYEGFRNAMAEAHLTVHSHEVKQGDFTFQSGVTAATALLADKSDRPSAIFASNDEMAAGVVSVAAKLGIDIPSELSVVGFDDTPLARLISPQLTTVQQPIYDMGYEAVRMLIDPAENTKPPKTQELDFKLIIRDSTST